MADNARRQKNAHGRVHVPLLMVCVQIGLIGIPGTPHCMETFHKWILIKHMPQPTHRASKPSQTLARSSTFYKIWLSKLLNSKQIKLRQAHTAKLSSQVQTKWNCICIYISIPWSIECSLCTKLCISVWSIYVAIALLACCSQVPMTYTDHDPWLISTNTLWSICC